MVEKLAKVIHLNTGYGSSNYESHQSRKKKEEDLNPENLAKKNLMKGLFGGLGGEEESKPQKTKKLQK